MDSPPDRGPEEIAIGTTPVEVDEALLERVLRISGARTVRDAVDSALREYIERRERIAPEPGASRSRIGNRRSSGRGRFQGSGTSRPDR
ncbi:type II toxin-antitoxin system VapB family antitoxin [Glycomyces xiaoerkulensis]|uniref:type II toxin-antitoxin system VapB family antitoxin n=1 Tax=Glycomyces xiaoerkulensis TaxID=2038139 RepID=UPI001E285D32|nr:type II toxin-antitoxin system VapB family antitoxin [Glycomyces xiaoerkulensis]